MRTLGISLLTLALVTTAASGQNANLKASNNQILIDEIKRGFDPGQIAQDAARAKAGEDLSAIVKDRNQQILIDEVKNGADPQKIGEDAATAKAGGELNPADDASAGQPDSGVGNKIDNAGDLNNSNGSSGQGGNIGTQPNTGGSSDADVNAASQGGGQNSVGQSVGQQLGLPGNGSGGSGVDSKINGDFSGQGLNSNGSKPGDITTQPNTGGSSDADVNAASQGGGQNSEGQSIGQQLGLPDNGASGDVGSKLDNSGNLNSLNPFGGSGSGQAGSGNNSVGGGSSGNGIDAKLDGLNGQGGGLNSVGGQGTGLNSNGGQGSGIDAKLDGLNGNGGQGIDGKLDGLNSQQGTGLNSNIGQGSGQNSNAASSGGNGGSNSNAAAQPKQDEADTYDANMSEDDRLAEAMKNTQNNDAAAEKLSHDADKGILVPKDVNEAAQLYSEMAELYKEFQDYAATANQDKLQEPQLDANGGPGLPVHCKAMDEDALAAQYNAKKAAIAAGKKLPAEDPNAGQCVPCYEEAEKGINKRRIAFEQLRIVLNYTQKMSTQGENALSGFGAAGGSIATLEAQSQIRKVDEAMEGFYVAYDGKYAEILVKLKGSLDDFAKCETKYFNNPDWYDRYGFIYYQFMADKYKRN